MDKSPSLTGTKRKILVRKSREDVDKPGVNYEDDTYIPLAASDSAWAGITVTRPDLITDDGEEYEIQVVELEGSEHEPIKLLFPELNEEELMKLYESDVSTTSITKMLVGKKPDFSLFKSSQKPNLLNKLDTLEECSESSSEESNTKKRKKPKVGTPKDSESSEYEQATRTMKHLNSTT